MTKPSHFNNTKYLFAGAGAGAILLLLCMEQEGLLEEGNVVLIEPESKIINDKTFCFWDAPDSFSNKLCKNIISKSWGKIRIDQHDAESLPIDKYHHISSVDLYAELHRLKHKYNMLLVNGLVTNIEAENENQLVETNRGNWLAEMVFDSRPPEYVTSANNGVHLIQSFIGWMIQTENNIADVDCVNLMDFNVDQLNFTQFVYVLPFSENKVLVELTRFGNQTLSSDEADPILKRFINNRFGSHSILDIEIGAIPMSSVSIKKVDRAGLVSLGGRAGAIKPSTGYAFKNMLTHAKNISSSIKNNTPVNGIKNKNRFKIYDLLLLDILNRTPEKGKQIFGQLFKNNKTTDVLTFLDEKTNFLQELKIFFSLPIAPFVAAFLKYLFYRHRKIIAPILLLTLTIGLLLLQQASPSIYSITEKVMLLGGLVLLGIPHGAIDHLLESNKLDTKPDIRFLVKYIGIGFSCFLIWLATPSFALFFFLVYSIWHFGQADWKEWRPASINSWNNIFWGTLLFGIILYGHAEETNLILKKLGDLELVYSKKNGFEMASLFAAIGIIWGVYKKCFPLIISCVMLWLGTGLPLITAFGLYFIGQHSFNSWTHLKKQMNVNNWALFKKALFFTVGAIFLYLVLLYSMDLNTKIINMDPNTISTFFIFLSCISLPHVLVMNNFYKKFITT